MKQQRGVEGLALCLVICRLIDVVVDASIDVLVGALMGGLTQDVIVEGVRGFIYRCVDRG